MCRKRVQLLQPRNNPQRISQSACVHALPPPRIKRGREEVVLRNKHSRPDRPRSAVYHSNSFRSSVSGSSKGSLRGKPIEGQIQLVQVYDDTKKVPPPSRHRFSTSVQRPIEKVYTRPYGSIKQRPRSVHVLQTQPVYTTIPTTVDLNQNQILINGDVLKGDFLTNGHASPPSSPRDTIIRT